MTAISHTDETFVILVDEKDRMVGIMGKMVAHREALLHRAVSVFITNSKGDWILQRRASGKYHSKGLWSNTCCSHPYPGETSLEAAGRRLMEEMGITCQLTEIFCFTYRESFENGLTENELDHIFVGISDDLPRINQIEVEEWKAVPFGVLTTDLNINPDLYTIWFRKLYPLISKYLTDKNDL